MAGWSRMGTYMLWGRQGWGPCGQGLPGKLCVWYGFAMNVFVISKEAFYRRNQTQPVFSKVPNVTPTQLRDSTYILSNSCTKRVSHFDTYFDIHVATYAETHVGTMFDTRVNSSFDANLHLHFDT